MKTRSFQLIKHFAIAIYMLAMCLLLAQAPARAQKKSLLLTHFNGQANQDIVNDTFHVQTLFPADLSHLIGSHEKVVIFIYKPYCPGVKEYFNEEASFLRKAVANGYYVVFLATAAEGLENIPEIISRKYGLGKLNFYVIDDNVERKKYEEASLQKAKKCDVIVIRDGKLLFNVWSYRLSHKDEERL